MIKFLKSLYEKNIQTGLKDKNYIYSKNDRNIVRDDLNKRFIVWVNTDPFWLKSFYFEKKNINEALEKSQNHLQEFINCPHKFLDPIKNKITYINGPIVEKSSLCKHSEPGFPYNSEEKYFTVKATLKTKRGSIEKVKRFSVKKYGSIGGAKCAAKNWKNFIESRIFLSPNFTVSKKIYA